MAYHGKPPTARQKQFIDAYLANGGDGKAAAIAVGYSPNTAKQQACNMLAEPNITDYVRRRQKRAAEAAQVTAERVMQELAAIGFAKMTDVVEWDEQGVRPRPSSTLTDEQAAAISSVTPGQFGVQVKMHGKGEALNTLARALSMLKDNVNVKTDVLDRLREAMDADDGE